MIHQNHFGSLLLLLSTKLISQSKRFFCQKESLQ